MKQSLLTALFLYLSLLVWSQSDSIRLLTPTGRFPVGTISYEWTDTTRNIHITSHSGDKRTICVQLWYPANIDSQSIPAPYSALSKDYRQVTSHSYLRPSFTDQIKQAPLLLFSPGRGTERFLYTTLIEELASHGYIVASVDMPDIGYVLYADGLILTPSTAYKPPRGMMGGPYEKVDQFFEVPTQLGYEDLSFAYHKIAELNAHDPHHRFRDKINLDQLGIFGHSLGGRIAGKFAVEHPHVKAYISMEGIPPRDIRYQGKMTIPIALLCSSGTWPYAKENYFSLIDNRSAPVFMIELPDFGHNSVTDNPFIYPESFGYEIEPGLGLEISRKIVLGYFESIFQAKETAFLDTLEGIEQIHVDVY